jgi:hypothetical protein
MPRWKGQEHDIKYRREEYPCAAQRKSGRVADNGEGLFTIKRRLMKQIIPLSAIAGLAELALVGCNQSSPGSSTETRSPDSNMNHANGMMGGTTNVPATNSMSSMNMPANTKTSGAANDATR